MSSRLNDTERAHTPISQSSVVHTSQVQQQQPEHRTRNWRKRSCDISKPLDRDKRFFRNVLRQNIIYERFRSYYPPSPGTDVFEQAVQLNN